MNPFESYTLRNLNKIYQHKWLIENLIPENGLDNHSGITIPRNTGTDHWIHKQNKTGKNHHNYVYDFFVSDYLIAVSNEEASEIW